MKHLKLFLIPLLVFVFNTCTDDDPYMPTGEEKTVFDVTFTDETVYIDSLSAQNLTHIDSANYTYYFQGSDTKIKNLKKDDILLIHGVALRKVTKVTASSNETKVETAYATLNEAIKDGTIAWNKEINFKKGVLPTVEMKGQNIEVSSVTADGLDFEFSYGEFKYKIKFVFSDTKADVEFEVTKSLVKPLNAKFTAKGSIEKFNSSAEIVFENQELIEFGQKNTNLKGDLTLGLAVVGSGRDNITFDFPVVLIKYPVMVGPIPVVINLKVLFVINCVVPNDGSSQVEVKFEYNSITGFQYNGSDVTADASAGKHSMDKTKAQTGASSAIGVNYGMAFPRIEIGIFDNVIVPYVQTSFLIGGDYTFTPACQQAKSQFIGACGVNFKFFGFSYNAKKTLWQEEKVLLKSGDCP